MGHDTAHTIMASLRLQSPPAGECGAQTLGGESARDGDAGCDACDPNAQDKCADNNEPPLLDHTLYPHIMDDIVRFSAPAALLRMRGTSREYKDKVDGVFASHIVISTSSTPSPSSSTSSSTSSSSSFLDVSPYMAPRFRPPMDLRRTLIVDLVGPVGARVVAYRCSGGKTGSELYLEYLASKLPNVDLVRLRSDAEGKGTSSCPIRTRSLVAFTQFSEPDSSGYPSTASVGPIPDTVERLVLNVGYEPRSWWLPRASLSVSDLVHHPNLSHVVVILSPRNSSPGCGRAYGECLGPAQWMGMMCSIVNLICYTVPRVTFTLVGVDKLEAEWVGIEPDWAGTPPSTHSSLFDFRTDTVVHLVQDAIAAELRRRHDWDFDEVDAVLEKIRFVSRARYEREITPRQFELETIE